MKTTKSGRVFTSNPMVRKLGRINERSEEHVTAQGISNKCLYFMLTLFAGIALAIAAAGIGPQISLGSISLKGISIGLSSVSQIGLIGFAAAGIIVLFVPFFAFMLRKTAAVTGTLYCVATGYLYTFLCLILTDYRLYVCIAASITILVCMAMFALYRTGAIKVTNKLRAVVTTLVLASLLGGIILLVFSFIPALQFIPAFFVGNSVLTIAFSVVGVVIAVLFLLVDFDTVSKAVENEIPKEYEWYCAFSLAFSVIWLFGKILELVVRIAAASKK